MNPIYILLRQRLSFEIEGACIHTRHSPIVSRDLYGFGRWYAEDCMFVLNVRNTFLTINWMLLTADRIISITILYIYGVSNKLTLCKFNLFIHLCVQWQLKHECWAMCRRIRALSKSSFVFNSTKFGIVADFAKFACNID